jgi:hypothetical protein
MKYQKVGRLGLTLSTISVYYEIKSTVIPGTYKSRHTT